MRFTFIVDYDDDGHEHPILQHATIEMTIKEEGADKREAVEAFIQLIREMVK